MKRFPLFLLMAAIMVLAGCKKDNTPKDDGVKIELSQTTLRIEVGQRVTLTADVTPESKASELVWSTDDEFIATVTKTGRVTAISEGEATITATIGSVEATCVVTVVEEGGLIEGVTLNKSTLELNLGGTETLVATVLPEDATGYTLEWSSSNGAVSVDQNGTVTANVIGAATITVTVSGKSDSCEVTVTDNSLVAPKVNDYYYSDGTWSTTKNADKTCVGLVYAVNYDCSTDPSNNLQNDPNNPDLINLVMGFKETGPVVWDLSNAGSSGAKAIANQSLFSGEYVKTSPAIVDNISNFPIFEYAAQLAEESGLNYYVPSYRELRAFILIFNGGEVTAIPNREDDNKEADLALQASLLPDREAYNAMLTEAGGASAIIPGVSSDTPWQEAEYWTASTGKAYFPAYDQNSGIAMFMYHTGVNIFPWKNNEMMVRPILSFKFSE